MEGTITGAELSTNMGVPATSRPRSESLAGAGTGNGEEKAGKIQRQSYSCAECKRLKLKCSRSWPCTSCEKRGCAQICPNGTIRTGKGKRLILADTEELHQRISLLEIALAQAHGQTSTTAHPLLSSTYLYSPRDRTSVKKNAAPAAADADGDGTEDVKPAAAGKVGSASTGPESDRIGALKGSGIEGDGVSEGEEDVVDSAFGTLTIGRGGEARFVGSFAGSEYLRTGIGSGDGEEGDADVVEEGDEGGGGDDLRGRTVGAAPATPPDSAMPFGGRGFDLGALPRAGAPGIRIGGYLDDIDVEALRRVLPDWEGEGRDLIQNYWDNAYWMYQVIPQHLFEPQFLLPAYDPNVNVHPHQLAVVFLMMAVGVMFDLHRPPFDTRGGELFALGQACLSAVGLEHATPSTVRALHLCGTYVLNDKHGSGAEIFWPVLGTAVKVAYSLGLHRDGSMFGLSPEETEERRLVWWELVTYDRFQATCFARPYGIASRFTDTKMPTMTDSTADVYHNTKYRIVELMEKVIDVQTQVTPISHSLIKSLDTELVEFKKSLPEILLPSISVPNLPLDPTITPHLVMHRLTVRLLIAQCRLLLSRPFFARALSENPNDPSFSKHGASFIALYEAAQEIIQVVQHLIIYHPSLIARWWFFWFHAFSSACCFAAIVIRAPTSAFASSAFDGLTIVCDIAAAAREGCRAKKGLPVLVRLRARAQQSMRKAGRHGPLNGTGRPNQPGQFAAFVAAPPTRQIMGAGPKAADEAIDTEADPDADAEDDDLGHLTGRSKLRRVRESNMRSGSRGSTDSPTDSGSALPGLKRRSGSNNQTSPAGYGQPLNTSPGATGLGGIGVEGTAGNATLGGASGIVGASGYGGVLGQGMNGRPDVLVSPRSVTSTATSTTLAEKTWEGVVPPPPPFNPSSISGGLGMNVGPDSWPGPMFVPRTNGGNALGGAFSSFASGGAGIGGSSGAGSGWQHGMGGGDHAVGAGGPGSSFWSPPPTSSSLTSGSTHHSNIGVGAPGQGQAGAEGTDFDFSAFLASRPHSEYDVTARHDLDHNQTAASASFPSHAQMEQMHAGNDMTSGGYQYGSGSMGTGMGAGMDIGMDIGMGMDMGTELDLGMDLDMSMALGFGEASVGGTPFGTLGIGMGMGIGGLGGVPGEWDWESLINGTSSGAGAGLGMVTAPSDPSYS